MIKTLFSFIFACSLGFANQLYKVESKRIPSAEDGVSFTYNCQIGEKPGVPTYGLEVINGRFKVWKKIAVLETTQVSVEGILNKKEHERLKAVLIRLSKISLSTLKPEELEGYFSLEFKVDGKKISATGGSSKKLSALAELSEWIVAFHKRQLAQDRLHPIFPGDVYQVSY